MAWNKIPEVVDGTPQSKRQNNYGCERACVRSPLSLKQHAPSYADTGLIKLVLSAVNSMPRIEANTFEFDEKNGGHSPEVS